ncbi:uncharacterized protein LOC118743211 [Rhagoletis pomonella]|uniref:uncharacterized protein LOC118743211 n=1 Tax=Rhagoletis pomonella TaxID=28610 RepID=UPI00177D0541|nr:uncharacterized protein LOC118743211 [Rhagoletis pomonella]
MLLARKSLPLPLTLPAKFTTKACGRRYLPHHSTYYRRGCPLCGKFRYDADEALTLSVESGLDVPTTSTTLRAERVATEIAVAAEDAICVASSSSELRLANRCQQLTAMDDRTKGTGVGRQGAAAEPVMVEATDELEKCACTVDILESSSTVIIDSDANGNHNSSEVTASANNNAVNAVSKEMMIDQNANGQTITDEVSTDVIAASRPKDASINEFVTSYSHTMEAVASNMPEDTTLDAINANSGIIRVDMSKIIDQTGLPTYEAAAKLESSGYV